ncbi:hypothetical protein NGC02_01545 [Mammaliicoccus sciuri]|uniref:hypothetical protein n=1 Tax=Mammaliicoccus sciuri TaxID=1296 RepID=UPI002DB8AEA0|nr:hypothetical protein [Mammaliicoccus sciuri]MEB7400194.1 hypothetical protein [Mammaliicoccus sciuri]
MRNKNKYAKLLLLFMVIIYLSGCSKESEIKEYEKLVQDFNISVLNDYPLQNINNDIYIVKSNQNDTMNHSIIFYETFDERKKQLDKYVKFRFYNKELIELHKLLDSQYLNISTSVTIFGSENYTRETLASDEYKRISNSLVEIDKILKKHNLKSKIDFSNDYISKKEQLEDLHKQEYNLSNEENVTKFMNDFFKGLQILDINNNVFEKGTIDGYQSLLFDLLANHAAINFKYDDISEAIDYKEQLRYKYSSLRKIAPDIKTKYYMFGYTIRKHE